MNAAPQSLDNWLVWQENLHHQRMDLGVERASQVWARLSPPAPAPLVITVGGTNGKGSAVSLLQAILQAAGYRVGSYTSPCLQHLSEQICVDGESPTETALCEAFQRVEIAREGTPLTAFEFTTLAVFSLFQQSALQIALLEVGLGGREDVVNVVDADAALITTVDLDHQAYLGNDRESIGWHKAGIFRPHKPAVCADPDPPQRLLEYALEIGTPLILRGVDFRFSVEGEHWHWQGMRQRFADLPRPALPGQHQIANAAGVLALLEALSLPVERAAIATGLQTASLPGRSQIGGEPVQWWLDVAHNRQSLAALAQNLADHPRPGRTLVVVGMLADKDASALGYLADQTAAWYPATLTGPRGRTGQQLADVISECAHCPPPMAYDGVSLACEAALRDARPGDRIVVCGSFLSVAAALEIEPMRQWNHG